VGSHPAHKCTGVFGYVKLFAIDVEQSSPPAQTVLPYFGFPGGMLHPGKRKIIKQKTQPLLQEDVTTIIGDGYVLILTMDRFRLAIQ
jgi:hypothetical protein